MNKHNKVDCIIIILSIIYELSIIGMSLFSTVMVSGNILQIQILS